MSSQMGTVLLGSACAMLAACGGGNDGGFRLAPAPPASPPPPPPTAPAPEPTEPPEGSIGLVSDEPFAVVGIALISDPGTPDVLAMPELADIVFRYDASHETYTIALPGLQPGVLMPVEYSGNWNDDSEWIDMFASYSQLLDADGARQNVEVFLRWPAGPLNPEQELTYTSFGIWTQAYDAADPPASVSDGLFAYGIATAASDVPTTGTARYSGAVYGSSHQTMWDNAYVTDISGTVSMLFDFGAGTLSGEMNPTICFFDCLPLGVYSFINTVYSSGSPSFAGQFAIDGVASDSWFEGGLNGPDASEAMAAFLAPYTAYAGTPEEISGTMSGIWLAKRN